MTQGSGGLFVSDIYSDTMAGKIKDTLIAAVLISFLVVIYVLGQNYSFFDGVKPLSVNSGSTAASVEAMDLSEPDKIIVSSGSGQMYSVDPDRKLERGYQAQGVSDPTLYASFMAEFKSRVSGSAGLSKTDASKFSRAVSENSASAVYSFRITLEDLESCAGIEDETGGSDKVRPSIIVIPAYDRNSAYIWDSTAGKYYRIKSENDAGVWSSMADALAGTSDGTETAYRLSSDTGKGAGFVPDDQVQLQIPEDSSYLPEYRASDESSLDRLEKMFFSKGTDFVRISRRADGNVSYRYRYMQKVLTVSESGRVYYHEQFDSDRYEEKDFSESLRIAASYIESHGGLPDSSGVKVFLKKADRKAIDKKYKGYDFEFGISYKGMRLVYPENEGDMLSVSVRGGQVTGYFRDLPTLEDEGSGAASPETAEKAEVQAQPLSQIVSANASELASALDSRTAETDLQEITDSIRSAEICLYRVPDGMDPEAAASGRSTESTSADRLVPAWHISAGDRDFWFRASDGVFIASDNTAGEKN